MKENEKKYILSTYIWPYLFMYMPYMSTYIFTVSILSQKTLEDPMYV